MAKSLGMIHTVNHKLSLAANPVPGLPAIQAGATVDLAGELTRQLQRMVHQGNYLKIVGIDMTIDAGNFLDQAAPGGIISGNLLFFQPTRGRCAAYRNAYRAVTAAMRDQGINYRADDLYDFRCAFTTPSLNFVEDFPNVATLDGTNPLVFNGSNKPDDSDNIFRVHNSNIAPASSLQTQPIPFGLYGNTSDFRLNEAQPYSGNEMAAHETPESIPFTAAYDATTEEFVVQFDWRPDPALYVAVMGGLFFISVDSVILNEDESLECNFAFHVSGWKSIMGSPDKKKRSSKKRSSRKTSSHGRKSKK